jgi:DNA-binding transcriptional LysR family regulator
MPRLDWDDLRYALVLSRCGRLGKAARALRVNETTVARRVARMEQELGARLFERTNGLLALTEIGRAVVQRAERMEADVCAIKSIATGVDDRVAGGVRLTAVPLVMNRMLTPALPRLLRAHPQLRLQLVSDTRVLSLSNREADVALRFARPEKDYRFLALRLFELPYGVYGPAAGAQSPLPWITFEDNLSTEPLVRWLTDAVKREEDAEPGLVVNDSDVATHAVRAGLGRMIFPLCVGDREAGLVRLSGPEPVIKRELSLLVHPDLRGLARVKAVTDWIEGAFAELGVRRKERESPPAAGAIGGRMSKVALAEGDS